MNKTSIASLVLLNIVLLGALVFVTFGGDGQAHAVNASSARGQYVAVSGTIAGSKTPIIWIVDQASQEVVAVQFDAQSDQLVGFGYRNMNNDAITVEKSRQ